MPYTPSGQARELLDAIADHGPIQSADLSKRTGVPSRQIKSKVLHAIRNGVVVLDMHGYSIAPGVEWRTGFSRTVQGVSVKRPAVARDVWQYAQGMK